MAHVHGECSVLMPDGAPCRRVARFACGNWHLICVSHRTQESVRAVDSSCPMCQTTLLQFTAIEDSVTPRRRHDDFANSVSNFFRRAAETWLPELHEANESRRSTDES